MKLTNLSELLERNLAIAGSCENGLKPNFSTLVLTCVDARVDLACFLGLQPGEALVMRKPGARVTAEVELEIAILWALGEETAGTCFQGMEMAIIHHTDCGMERLEEPGLRAKLSKLPGVAASELNGLAIEDHAASIRRDIKSLRAANKVPDDLLVSGFIYDLADGRLHRVDCLG